ncbi:MAG TPA: class I SAM-dependent methyltransferase [Caulobacteraceae bacterium]
MDRIVVAAPPGTLERRFVLAHALRALRPGGELLATAPKDKGGARLRGELEAFGCTVNETAKRHQRLCLTRAPAQASGLAAAIEAGGPRMVTDLGLWSQPGVFSWDRIDPGTALLLGRLTDLAGRGADLGCGIGVLARAALALPEVSDIVLIDIDRRAIAAASRNIDDPRARFLHADARHAAPGPAALDFVIMNPPFHEGGVSEPALGQALIAAAARMLRTGGVCRLVANVALPYEAALGASFSKVRQLHEANGYKLIEALR